MVVDGPYAVHFDELNGDYREVCLTVFRRDGSIWEELLYTGDAGYPDVGEEPGRATPTATRGPPDGTSPEPDHGAVARRAAHGSARCWGVVAIRSARSEPRMNGAARLVRS